MGYCKPQVKPLPGPPALNKAKEAVDSSSSAKPRCPRPPPPPRPGQGKKAWTSHSSHRQKPLVFRSRRSKTWQGGPRKSGKRLFCVLAGNEIESCPQIFSLRGRAKHRAFRKRSQNHKQIQYKIVAGMNKSPAATKSSKKHRIYRQHQTKQNHEIAKKAPENTGKTPHRPSNPPKKNLTFAPRRFAPRRNFF